MSTSIEPKLDRVPIINASDLPECGLCEEKWCPIHEEHFADCPCVGISNMEEEGYEPEIIDGILYGVRRNKPH
jgi:hypothetical protein